VDDIDRTEERLGGPIHAAPSSLSAQLLDQLADAVLVTDADGRYVEANLAATTMLGYTRAELLSMSITDVTAHPREWSASEFTRLFEDGYWRGMVDLRRKDGSLVRVEARASSLETPEGRWGVAVLREIDEEPGAGSTVAERRLAAIVQSSDDAIFSVTADGLIESWNPARRRGSTVSAPRRSSASMWRSRPRRSASSR
jgi:PAS domain S-box-containing protein